MLQSTALGVPFIILSTSRQPQSHLLITSQLEQVDGLYFDNEKMFQYFKSEIIGF